jgi:hypothetical protein
MMCSFGYGSVK